MTERLPVVRAAAVIRALERAGFAISRTSGSHCRLVHCHRSRSQGDHSTPRRHRPQTRHLARHHRASRSDRGRVRRTAITVSNLRRTIALGPEMNDLPVTIADIRQAAAAIAGAVRAPPTIAAPALSELAGAEIYLKLETLHRTGSFKERGALNKLLTLSPEQRRVGVVAMSAGNHAQGVAYHARRLGIPATIVMPEGTPFIKIDHTEAFGATVVLKGDGLAAAREAAQALARERGLAFVHPYDDPAVIAGQGTIALELLADRPDLDTIVVPIGGGGLISGIAVAAKALAPRIEIVGVQSIALSVDVPADARRGPRSAGRADDLGGGDRGQGAGPADPAHRRGSGLGHPAGRRGDARKRGRNPARNAKSWSSRAPEPAASPRCSRHPSALPASGSGSSSAAATSTAAAGLDPDARAGARGPAGAAARRIARRAGGAVPRLGRSSASTPATSSRSTTSGCSTTPRSSAPSSTSSSRPRTAAMSRS